MEKEQTIDVIETLSKLEIHLNLVFTQTKDSSKLRGISMALMKVQEATMWWSAIQPLEAINKEANSINAPASNK